MGYSFAIVNLKNIENNVKLIKEKLNKKVKFCAVVKSDAYGHGIVKVSNHLEQFVDYFAVSFLEEGLKLRYSGIKKPIIILLPIKFSEILIASRYNLTITITQYSQLKKIKDLNVPISFHVKINSGMNRLGVSTEKELKDIINFCKDNKKINFCGIFSHFYTDVKENCVKQYEIFKNYVKIAKKYDKRIIAHICASTTALKFANFQLDMVRIGIGMYGYLQDLKNIKPALKIYALKLQDRVVKKGENLLYGDYGLQNTQKISIIKYGYADGGVRRQISTFNNRCMDMSAVPYVKKYCVVMDNAQKMANFQGTIPYEVLVTYTLRCKHVYIYENYCWKTQGEKT